LITAAPIVTREATFADVEAIQAMFAHFVESSQYRQYIGNNPEYSMGLIERLIGNDDGTIFVADDNGTVVGMIGLAVYPHPMSGDLVATEAFWWLNPEKRGYGVYLLRKAEKWAKAKGARSLAMMAPCDNPRVQEIYTKLGYDAVEITYQRSLA
jgi:GNAT superfamily N-acetyltransferase